MNIANSFARAFGASVMLVSAYYLAGWTGLGIAVLAGLFGQYAQPTSAFRDIGRWLAGIIAGLWAALMLNWPRGLLPLLKWLGIATIVAGALWLLSKLSMPKVSLSDWHLPSWQMPSISSTELMWLLALLAALAALYALASWRTRMATVFAPRRQFNWEPLSAALALLTLLALLLTQCDDGSKKPGVRAPAPAVSTTVAPKLAVAPTPAKWTPKVLTSTAVRGDGGVRMIAKLYNEKYSIGDALALAKQHGWA